MTNRVEEVDSKEITLSNLLKPNKELSFDVETFIPGVKIINLQNHLGFDGSISILEFNVILLDKQNKPISIYRHSKGGIDATICEDE